MKSRVHDPACDECCPALLSLTTDGDLFAVAGGDAVDVGQHPEPLPRLEQELEDVARVQLLLRHRGLSKISKVSSLQLG